MTSNTALATGASVASILLIWEHMCRVRGIRYRPSVALHKTADQMASAARWTGRQVARLSSFLLYLPDISGVLKTLGDLGDGVVSVVASPIEFFQGYAQAVRSLYNSSPRIVIGSGVLVGAAAALAVWGPFDHKLLVKNYHFVVGSAGSTKP